MGPPKIQRLFFLICLKSQIQEREIFSLFFFATEVSRTMEEVQRGLASLMFSRAEAAYPGQSLFKYPHAKNSL